jgi:tellurite resistance protein TerA
MSDITKGGNAPLPSSSATLEIGIPAGSSIDVTALQLYANGKVRGDGDMCFFNQTEIGGGAIRLSPSAAIQRFEIDTARIGTEVEKIVITAAIESGSFSNIAGITVNIVGGPRLVVDTAGRSEAALILCEIYRRNNEWKIRNVSQGFNGGLQALAEHFGVEVAASAPAPTPTPAAKPAPAPAATPAPAPKPVRLNKVSLTKNDRTVSLKKDGGKFGKILVNLNWNQKKSGGFFGMGAKGIDLDLGAFVEFKQGSMTVVQALGEMFGDYNQRPFIKLRADDRSGASTDGEWLEINGDQWEHISRVLIFAFIYEGVANWQETDGAIRLMVPGQPEIEVRMNELGTSSRDTMCAVANLVNEGGQIKVSREVRFFSGHELMDRAYSWGFQWRAGRK